MLIQTTESTGQPFPIHACTHTYIHRISKAKQ